MALLFLDRMVAWSGVAMHTLTPPLGLLSAANVFIFFILLDLHDILYSLHFCHYLRRLGSSSSVWVIDLLSPHARYYNWDGWRQIVDNKYTVAQPVLLALTTNSARSRHKLFDTPDKTPN